MKDSVKKWVEALESGQYEPGKDFLTRRVGDKDYDCCLGVACKSYTRSIKTHLSEEQYDDCEYSESFRIVSYGPDREEYNAPENIQKWLGLRTPDGLFSYASLKEKNPTLAKEIQMKTRCRDNCSLVDMNDNGVDFKTIAKVIRLEPEGLFK